MGVFNFNKIICIDGILKKVIDKIKFIILNILVIV